MGDRVLMQVVGKNEFSPVLYGHWSGESSPQVCERIRARMHGREKDVPFTAARLVQELIGDGREGNLGFGIWNAEAELTEKDSHGDAGIIIVDVTENVMRFRCMGGYLKVSDTTGLPYMPEA